MSSLMIVGLAPLGVAMLIGLVALFGGNQRATLNDEADALARLRKDFANWQGDDVVMSDDKHIALIPSADKTQIGIVFAVGDHFATRVVAASDIDLPSDKDADARLHFHDFSAPDLDLPRSLLARANVQPAA